MREIPGEKPAISALRPLDGAADFLRGNFDRVFPLYIAGIAPMSAAAFYLIDAVSAGRRSALGEGCLLLALAAAWKWIFTSAIQRRILEKITGAPPAPLAEMIPAVICVKLFSSVLLLWGSFFVLPSIYGFFLSGLCAPILLDRRMKAVDAAEWALKWIHGSMSMAAKILSALSALFFFAALGAELIQMTLLQAILPSLLGIDAPGLELTLSSLEWNMALFFIISLAFDLYWTIGAVMLYLEIQSRRAGVDLSARLTALGG